MELNPISTFQLSQKLFIPFQRQIGMKAALHQDPTPTQLESLFYLPVDLFKT